MKTPRAFSDVNEGSAPFGKRGWGTMSLTTGLERRTRRIMFQMNAASLPYEKLMRALELIGTRVAPMVREGSGQSPPYLMIESLLLRLGFCWHA